MSDWHFGTIDTASAVLAEGRLIVRVDGRKPAPCIDVKLAEYPREANGPSSVRMGLYWRHRPEPCAARETPYTAHAEVDVRGIGTPTLRIDDANGYRDVRVRQASPGATDRIPGPPG